VAFNDLSGVGRPATGTLSVDGKVVRDTEDGENNAIQSAARRDFRYRLEVPFAFTGNLNKLTISVEPPKLTPEDEKKLQDAQRAAQDAK
jgi:hypothetical protein